MIKTMHIIGGGLAGCEAAWQGLKRGCHVVLYEMRPNTLTPAHKTGHLAELVCSNSLKSLDPKSAPGLLKAELAGLDSLVLEAAMASRVPAGQALAVDRQRMSEYIERKLYAHPCFSRRDGEVHALPSIFFEQKDSQSLPIGGSKNIESPVGGSPEEAWVVATGPLTSPSLTESLDQLISRMNPGLKEQRLYFYDAIAPTIAAESIDWDYAFSQSRYDKGGADYINLPLDKDQYLGFVQAIRTAEYSELHAFESTKYFESCLPIEVMVERGENTLRFGPMKPVGLIDPRTERRPWAVVQLRKENLEGTMYSMVGFQTKMKWPEQKRVFGMIPALKGAEFLRYGSVHRNTYVQSPAVLSTDLSIKGCPTLFLAGQITGVEGYLESTAMGLLAGMHAASRLLGQVIVLPPRASMIGALLHYVTHGGLTAFQPMNCNFGLLPLAAESANDVCFKETQQASEVLSKSEGSQSNKSKKSLSKDLRRERLSQVAKRGFDQYRSLIPQ